MDVTSTRAYERVNLPLGEMPKGARWELVTGNNEYNLWQRKRRKKAKPTAAQLADKLSRYLRRAP